MGLLLRDGEGREGDGRGDGREEKGGDGGKRRPFW